jgi:hypothetical protein
MHDRGASVDGTTAEQPCQSSPHVKASQFRAAYEALIEPLIKATIKVAEADIEHQRQRAQIGSFEAEIVTLQSEIATLKAELAMLQTGLAASQADRADLAELLQAVYQSHSWRVTEPLRRAITLIRRLRS